MSQQPTTPFQQLKTIANEVRGLCFDMVSKANSGHLGLPLGCAECAAVLFGHFLRFLPKNPRWINRDRFVLSAGHGAPLLYAMLHLSGYDVTMEDLQTLRKSGSKATGHPEFCIAPGVETTTGPLGQGIGNAVGMALSQKKLAAELKDASAMIDNCIVCLCGDGCLQEGVGQESIALAGLWRLDNLILIYDCNHVTLDGDITVSQNENTQQKFEALGWEVRTVDGHQCEAIAQALDALREQRGKPKVLILKTIIGYGLSIAGTNKAHGPAGIKEGNTVKRAWGLDPEKSFFISPETHAFFEKRRKNLQKAYNAWEQTFQSWCEHHPDTACRLAKKPTVSADFFQTLSTGNDAAMRDCSGKMLALYAEQQPTLLTGSADLFESTKNYIPSSVPFSPEAPQGRNLFFGIREHAMGAILNGIAYDGFYQASGSTFFVFSDYLKPALRVAALSHLPVWYFFSHDSIAVGEDGPTHQPIEQLAALRAIPNVHVLRPADADECAACFRCAQDYQEGPSIFVTSRQTLPYLTATTPIEKFSGACRGGYTLLHETAPLQYLLLATGSEVHLALQTADLLGHNTRVVSMPCCEIFLQQDLAYQNLILPPTCVHRAAIEAGATQPWYRFVGTQGIVIGIDQFGFSASSDALFEKFGFTPEACARKIKAAFPIE